MRARPHSRLVALALFAAVLLAYLPLARHEWLSYDDGDYVHANPPVRAGLTLAGLGWAFTTTHAANYHPLTWLAHMLDVQLFGLEPGPHHLVNAGLHALVAVLVFVLLLELFANVAAAGLAAALFALHPLRVESVAWASERKDLLCALFYVAALLAYLWQWRGAPGAPGARGQRGGAALVLLLTLLALLAKPAAVTLPLVVLLLDAWPLGRFARAERGGLGARAAALCLEKWPLFALAALAALVTLWAQARGGATSSLSGVALELRFLNALRSLGVYLAQSAVPRGLSVFYPHAATLHAEPVRALLPSALAGAGVLCLGVGLAWRLRRRVPAVGLGAGIFLATLVPVLGLVQVGAQAHADRYTYLPSLGLVIALAGAGLALGARARVWLFALGCLATLFLGLATRRQLAHWRDTRSLFEHALLLDERNDLARVKLGELALEEGDEPRARAAFERALLANPRNVQALDKLALCQMERGELEEARATLARALALSPGDVEALTNMGLVELELGRLEPARRWLEAARARAPRDADVLFDLGVLELRTERPAEAEALFLAALARAPEHADAWSNLGQLRLADGRTPAALAAFERVVALAPDDPIAHFNLGIARQKAGDEAGARAALLHALALEPAFELARAALAEAAGGTEGPERR